MNRQRKLDLNLGKDTHARQYQANIFKQQSTSTFQMLAGEVLITEPEPLFKQNMVTVALARGGNITSVAYPGAFVEPVSGNIHGTYEGPIPGQMVMVGFENGNSGTPFVVNRYPYQGNGNTLTELAYTNPLTRALYDSTDVIMGHFSGSYISLNTGILSGQLPGSITVGAVTDLNLNANTNIALNSLFGLVSINSATQNMKTLVDAFLDILTNFGTTGSPTNHVTNAATKALIAAEKVKWALLLL